MNHLGKRVATFGLLCAAVAMPALAGSSAASSASDSVTTSLGSSSASVKRSSDSSTQDTAVTEGDYRVVAVDSVAERPGTLRMKLQAVADDGVDGELFLYLPLAAVEDSQLGQGGIVTARRRPYGTEFSSGQTRRAFFLVLHDDWYRELQSNAVVL